MAEGAERARSGDGASASAPRRPRLTAANFRYFLRGRSERAAEGDLVVAARKRAHLQPYDRLLRKFRHREALDAALATRRPEVVAAVLEELLGRGALTGALGGRDEDSLMPVLAFLSRYIADPRHSALLAEASKPCAPA